MRLNTSPLNRSVVGGASGAIGFVRASAAQIVRVVGSLRVYGTKYFKSTQQVGVAGALHFYRRVSVSIAGAVVVAGALSAGSLKRIYGAALAFVAVLTSATGLVRVSGKPTCACGVVGTMVGKVRKAVHGSVNQSVSVIASLSGVDISTADAPQERQIIIPYQDRTTGV